jgi:hypothetical protein
MIRFIGLAALLFTVSTLTAQENIQVVTKTINRSFALKPGESLVVEAEKADVRVRGWDREEVKLVLRLVAKHPERAVAEKDLPALRYRIDTDGAKKTISNFFRISESSGSISSNLQAQYELQVPQRCLLWLRNRYGNVRIEKLSTDLHLAVDFGEIRLDEVTGTVDLDIAYGDVVAQRVNATVTGVTKKSDLSFEELAGTLSLQSSYGETTVTTLNALESLSIQAARTEVAFSTTDPMHYHYQLTTTYDQIETTLPGTWQDGGLLGQERSFKSTNVTLPKVFINTSFSTITINSLSNEVSIPRTSSKQP